MRYGLGAWRWGWGFGLVLAAIAWPAGAVQAAQGIGISPTSQDLEVRAGSTTTGEITVLNDGDSPVTYRVYATDYTVQDEGYLGIFEPIKGAGASRSAVSWFTLPSGTMVVQPRDQVKLGYTLAVPADAAVGGHYAAVFVETVPPKVAGAAVVSRIERLGSIFYLAVAGDLIKRGSVESLGAKFWQQRAPVAAALRIKNTGNVHFAAQGKATLTPVFLGSGKPVNFSGEVLPGTVRRFDLSLPARPMGLYRLDATVSYLGRTETLSRMVLVMPTITLVVLTATGLLVLGLIVAWLARKLRRRR